MNPLFRTISVMLLCSTLLSMMSCREEPKAKVVVCVPVYGQSLALGEEAAIITDIDNLTEKYNGRLVGESLDDGFGYYENTGWKQYVKRCLRLDSRRYENSCFAMGEALASKLGSDTMVCVFAGGRGATPIEQLVKGGEPYKSLLDNIGKSYEKACEKGLEFYVPAICWMQGESDMYDYTRVNYKALLKQFADDVNRDIKLLTHQHDDVKIICYQSCCLAKCLKFRATDYDCYEATIPQAQLELIIGDSLFEAGTPIYFLDFVNHKLHLAGKGQQTVGRYNAMSALDIIRHTTSRSGLYPSSVSAHDDKAYVTFRTGSGHLAFDTIQVKKAPNYGFSVITPDGREIATSVSLRDSIVEISASESVKGCKVRYAVNGDKGKSGRFYGARGNLSLRKAGHLPEWCYMFSVIVP